MVCVSKALVIPCYNEEQRFSEIEIAVLISRAPEMKILLVDDGSKDGTAELLRKMATKHSQVECLILPENRGKAEAVRAGLVQMMSEGMDWVAYADADFATPASELVRLFEVAENEGPALLMGSRILLLGHHIERKPMRHFLGRIFATFASMALDLKVYDTQCGAKFIRNTPEVLKLMREPFTSRWAFDVELIGRLKTLFSAEQFVEEPLKYWRDVPGSKLRFASMVKAGLDLITIGRRLRRPAK